MNYIELINQYWQLREQGMITGAEGDLYLYLIHTSNKLNWKNPFNQSNKLICAILNTSEPTLIRHRNTLKQVGLIEFESGKAVRQNTQYYLNNFSSAVSRDISRGISSVVSRDDENTLDYIKHKLNKTKQELKEKSKKENSDFVFTENVKEFLLAQSQWIETLCMNLKVSKSQIDGYCSEFQQKYQNEAMDGNSEQELKVHFSRWVKIQNERKEKSCAKKESNYGKSEHPSLRVGFNNEGGSYTSTL
ncbi:MAG: hypothetical protein ACRCZB_07660 [Bacteroidales bacterium]